MTAPTDTPTTALTKGPSPITTAVEARRAEMRERNAMVAAIKGQMWGKDLSEAQAKALAHYCNQNNLDATRHVEVLGGRVYLTANFYEERGAPLIQRGIVSIEEPRYIHADPRLDKLAATGDEWATTEKAERERLRIRYAVPEEAKAAAIYEIRVTATGKSVKGVNWCGGTGKRDPVGDAEPTKTAITRAARRAWKQLVEVIPDYGAAVGTIQATAKLAGEEIVAIAEAQPSLHNAPPAMRPLLRAPDGEAGYGSAAEGLTAEASDDA